jgi:hypothetical protein
LVLKQAFGKSGQMPTFSLKSKVTVPKTEVLEQPQLIKFRETGTLCNNHRNPPAMATIEASGFPSNLLHLFIFAYLCKNS